LEYAAATQILPQIRGAETHAQRHPQESEGSIILEIESGTDLGRLAGNGQLSRNSQFPENRHCPFVL
jgi:hypothetical protein